MDGNDEGEGGEVEDLGKGQGEGNDKLEDKDKGGEEGSEGEGSEPVVGESKGESGNDESDSSGGEGSLMDTGRVAPYLLS